MTTSVFSIHYLLLLSHVAQLPSARGVHWDHLLKSGSRILCLAVIWHNIRNTELNWISQAASISSPCVITVCFYWGYDVSTFSRNRFLVYFPEHCTLLEMLNASRSTTGVSQTHCETCPGLSLCLGIVKSCHCCIINIVMTLLHNVKMFTTIIMDMHSPSCSYYWSQLVKISDSKIVFDHNFKEILFSTQILNNN